MNRKYIAYTDFGLGAANALVGIQQLNSSYVGNAVLSFLVAGICIALGVGTLRTKP